MRTGFKEERRRDRLTIEELRESVEESNRRIERSIDQVLSVKLEEDRRKIRESVEEDMQRLESRMQSIFSALWDMSDKIRNVQEEVHDHKVLLDRFCVVTDKLEEYARTTKAMWELKIRKVEEDVRWLKTSRQTCDLNAPD